jgi:hypothetical protein
VAEDSGRGTVNLVLQYGQSPPRPASSSSAFNFSPQDGQKNRNSITASHRIYDALKMRQSAGVGKGKEADPLTKPRQR